MGLLDRVRETISRYSMVPFGSSVGVAVSGGPDSVALLAALAALAAEWELRLHVLHLNHRLRGAESDADADFVAQLAECWGLPVLAESVGAWPAGNLEQNARRARLDFFRRARERLGLARVAVGHTRSDQAETVLLNLARGAGVSGLGGIHPVSDDGLVRPLIETDRAQVLEFLAVQGIDWREDSTNSDPRFRRNLVRHTLLPLLQREFNANIAEVLASTAAIARDEDCYWRVTAAALLARVSTPHPRGLVLTPDGSPPAVSRHLVREAIRRVKGDLRRIEFQHVEAVCALLAGDSQRRVALPGVEALRWDGRVFLGRPAQAVTQCPLQPALDLPDFGVRLVLCESGYNTDDWNELRDRLALRPWRPGDAYRPTGSARQIMLKDLFQRARIPLWDRPNWPIITERGQIVWARRFGSAVGRESFIVREENLARV